MATYFRPPYYSGTDCFSGNLRGPGQTDFDNPIFESVAVRSNVPIPAAFWLFGAGLLALAGIRKKFKK